MSRMTWLARRDEAQRARRRNAEMSHRLAAEEFADGRAKHGPPVGRTGVGRRARAFELQLPALARRVHHLPEADGPPVAELPCPGAELVPAVTGGVRCHPRQERVAREDLDETCKKLSDAQAVSDKSSNRATSGDQATSRGALTGTGAIGEKQAPRTPRTALSVSASPGSSRTKLLSKRSDRNAPSGSSQTGAGSDVWSLGNLTPARRCRPEAPSHWTRRAACRRRSPSRSRARNAGSG